MQRSLSLRALSLAQGVSLCAADLPVIIHWSLIGLAHILVDSNGFHTELAYRLKVKLYKRQVRLAHVLQRHVYPCTWQGCAMSHRSEVSMDGNTLDR